MLNFNQVVELIADKAVSNIRSGGPGGLRDIEVDAYAEVLEVDGNILAKIAKERFETKMSQITLDLMKTRSIG